jgi:hypothetical protein
MSEEKLSSWSTVHCRAVYTGEPALNLDLKINSADVNFRDFNQNPCVRVSCLRIQLRCLYPLQLDILYYLALVLHIAYGSLVTDLYLCAAPKRRFGVECTAPYNINVI